MDAWATAAVVMTGLGVVLRQLRLILRDRMECDLAGQIFERTLTTEPLSGLVALRQAEQSSTRPLRPNDAP